MGISWLAGGFNQPLWKMMEWKSVGMMTFPTEWKVIKFHGSKAPTRIIHLIFVDCFGITSPAHQENYDILATIRADKNMNHQQHQKWMGFPNIFKPLFTAFLSILYILGSPLSLFNQLGVIVSEVLKYVKNVTESFQIDRNFDLLYIYYVSVK